LKIAIATRFLYRAGGVETYLEHVLPALVARGHEVRVWHEFAPEPGAVRMLPETIIAAPIGKPSDAAFQQAAAWQPDTVFLHGLSSVALEERFAAIAPTVVFQHAYHGTCISGTKTHSFPATTPCSRTLGPGCLLQYYPRRCGGWHPLSMLNAYGEQRRRQTLLKNVAFVATLSEHMRNEVIAHGVDSSRATLVPPFTPPAFTSLPGTGRRGREERLHLAFVGRMETPKGGHVLIDALSQLDEALRGQLRVTFAGDGRERARLEQQTRRISSNVTSGSSEGSVFSQSSLAETRDAKAAVDVRFVGWLSPADRARLFSMVDLLVVPSLWPEPLGLVGLEAATFGVPAVAFDVGGISDWLTDQVTGRLVRQGENPSTALASALSECLADRARLRSWGAAARALSRRRTLADHVSALEMLLLRAVVSQPAANSAAAGTRLDVINGVLGPAKS
jgi:glycosyltransferase involved in cell wall biosynthesis